MPHYDPDHPETNRRSSPEHDLNDIFDQVRSLEKLVKVPIPDKTFLQKYGAYLVALVIPAVLSFAGYVTMGNTVDQLVSDSEKKADKEVVLEQFKTVDTRIDGVIERHTSDNTNTKEDLKDLNTKMDKTLVILIDISRDVKK